MIALLTNRRRFLGTAALALAGSAFAGRATAQTADAKLFSAMGIAGPLDKAAMFKAAGAEFLTESVGNFLMPDKSDADVAKNLEKLDHMAVMGDTPADLKAAMDVVVHLEIAEKEGRTVPGVGGDDFRPYFQVLKDAGYSGAVSIEGRWQDQQLAPAFKEIARQAAAV